ncbi:MAG TPA: phosphate signaling complex protein PhoU [Thermoanaerobaculia bacterium]|nr:phosphate signaling complex protein PhoU [Thermoanaerobaculia bacterium]HUM30674.1 phosphate signaling complex protein PhoU [Thermoanaerobaculia bacterium]HXK68918.1 phosphate signaling complex protein PhoU [Thermoanaerobaculia bacterium]
MTVHFHREVEALKKKVLALSVEVEGSLNQAMKAYFTRDIMLADRIIGADEMIDQKEVEVEEDILKILALHQPVAIDLRYLISFLKINNDLERIGDLAVNIADAAVYLAGNPAIEAPEILSKMTDKVLSMLRFCLEAMVNQDSEQARRICAMDETVDELHRSMYSLIEGKVIENPGLVDRYMHILSISRYLERVADHATNIAEDIIYMVEGFIVRHSLEDK